MISKNFNGGIKLLGIFLLFFLLVTLEAAPVKIKVMLDNASVKATRAIGGKTLTRVPLNTILDAESKIGDWYKVSWQGSSGYIHAMNVDEVSERELARGEVGGPGRPGKSQSEIVAEIEVKMDEGRKQIRIEKDFENAIRLLKPLIADVFNVTDHNKQKELGAELYLWLGLASAGQGDAYSALVEFKSMFAVNHPYAKEITRNILDHEIVSLIEQAEKQFLGLVTEYSIEITTVPKEAKIKVNGKEIGLSPEIYRTANPIIVIEIEKEGYKPVRDESFITKAATRKEYTLERAGLNRGFYLNSLDLRTGNHNFSDGAGADVKNTRNHIFSKRRHPFYPHCQQNFYFFRDLEKYEYIIVIYHMHLSKGWHTPVRPPSSSHTFGLFATRSPNRPNSIGFSVIKLKKVEGNILHVRGIDAFNKTPVLDIKPWLPSIDCPGGKINLDIEKEIGLKKKK